VPPYDRAMSRSPLRVLPSTPAAGPADWVRLFCRAQLQLARAVGEEQLLDGLTWIHSRDFQPRPEANCVLDAAVDPGGDPAVLLAEADAAAGDCPVRRWTLNPSLPPDRTVPLAEHLTRSGWTANPLDVLRLSRHRTPTATHHPSLTVIPARAAFGPFRALMAGRFDDAAAVDVAMLQVDDPHVDAWVALQDGAAVASVGLLNDGETGTVIDVFVAPPHRATGIGRHLLARTLDAAARTGHRHVLAGVRRGSTGLFTAMGFDPVGQWTAYERAGDPAEP
jgi:GNAT superfamily N-acetyltransferase